MNEDDEQGGSGMSLGRTLALSDGIFAIAMTLLAFQIQPPDLKGTQVHQLAQALGHLGNRYFAFLLSLTVIGLFWLAHHRLFGRIGRADEVLMSLNLLFLMTVAALPSPPAVFGQYGDQRSAVVLCASSMAVALLTSLTLVAHRRHLFLPGTEPESIRGGLWRGGIMAGVFALSIPVAVLAPTIAPYTWLTTLVFRLFHWKSHDRPGRGR